MSESLIKPGVVTGEALNQLLRHANENNYALPAVNVVGTNSINAVLETAKAVNSPVIIQFSNGGGIFYAGKSLSNEGQKAAIAGSKLINMLKVLAGSCFNAFISKVKPWNYTETKTGEIFYQDFI